jgi:hypothetical protein
VNATPSNSTPSSLDEGATLCRCTAEVNRAREALPSTGLKARRGVESTGLVEEPISAELVLVDPELARRARVALPDPPWLLPVLAEKQRAEMAAPAVFSEERSARPMPRVARRPRHRSVARHIAATLTSGCVLLILVVLVASAADLLSRSHEPTFSATAVRHAVAPQPNRSSVDAHAEASRKARRSEQRTKRPAKRSEARRSVNAKAGPKATPSARRVRTRLQRSTPAPKPAATTPRALAETQRVFSWRRHAAAVYYQFYFQRGATTIYQARTVKLSVALPARLKLRPGTYQVLVRPAIPSDAGVILGAAIIAKTIRV